MMISVEEALHRITALVAPLAAEQVPLAEAGGRVLARALMARRDQPPFASSSMDGYALKDAEARPGATFRVIGASAAGHHFAGIVGPGETVRIFTGAPVPEGADRVVMQEDVDRSGEAVTLRDGLSAGPFVRAAGSDFARGWSLSAPRLLSPADIALLAAMNHAEVPVVRRPVVALIATGDELVMPGEIPGPDQIITSNSFGLKALFEAAGATARLLPIARDRPEALKAVLELAADADLIVTIGGVSVGDHDLVAGVAEEMGLERSFYKVSMRPGKPLMAGKIHQVAMIGLPGNPVSAMVCATIFILPALKVMLGFLPRPMPRRAARLSCALKANGPREHYMRARIAAEAGGDLPLITPDAHQDSALLTVLAQADALLLRPPNDPARAAGETVTYLPL